MPRQLSSAAETGAELSVNPETIRRLHRAGRIPGYKVGRYLRFDVEEVRAALRTMPTTGSTAGRVLPDFDALDAA